MKQRFSVGSTFFTLASVADSLFQKLFWAAAPHAVLQPPAPVPPTLCSVGRGNAPRQCARALRAPKLSRAPAPREAPRLIDWSRPRPRPPPCPGDPSRCCPLLPPRSPHLPPFVWPPSPGHQPQATPHRRRSLPPLPQLPSWSNRLSRGEAGGGEARGRAAGGGPAGNGRTGEREKRRTGGTLMGTGISCAHKT